MVDLETLSTKPNAVIVTIAAVKFKFDSDETEDFEVNINPTDSKSYGLDISLETLNWWRKQKPEAVKAWQHSRISLKDALNQFVDFCGTDKNTLFYSQGINFDYPILESSFQAVEMKEIWKYWNLRDTRTIYWLAGLDTKNEKRVGNYHNALSDCHNQIIWLKKSLGK